MWLVTASGFLHSLCQHVAAIFFCHNAEENFVCRAGGGCLLAKPIMATIKNVPLPTASISQKVMSYSIFVLTMAWPTPVATGNLDEFIFYLFKNSPRIPPWILLNRGPGS